VLAVVESGVLEQMSSLSNAQLAKLESLDIAIYDIELKIIQAVRQPMQGVNVRVVYHAKAGDDQTVRRYSLEGLPSESQAARLTTNICHHKFIVE